MAKVVHAGVGAPATHRIREFVGFGWFRRYATTRHAPVWRPISYARGVGRTLYGCVGHPRCTRTVAG